MNYFMLMAIEEAFVEEIERDECLKLFDEYVSIDNRKNY